MDNRFGSLGHVSARTDKLYYHHGRIHSHSPCNLRDRRPYLAYPGTSGVEMIEDVKRNSTLAGSCNLEIPMKYVFVIGFLLFALTFSPAVAEAQEPAQNQNGFSLGLILGDPTGVTLRGGIGERSAIQAHFGYSFFPGDAVATMVDWTYDAWNFLPDNRTAALLFYFGFGAKLEWLTGRNYVYKYDYNYRYSDRLHFGFGGRGLVGIRVPFHKAPFDLFFELSPIGLLVVVPDTGVYYDVDFAIGARYRF